LAVARKERKERKGWMDVVSKQNHRVQLQPDRYVEALDCAEYVTTTSATVKAATATTAAATAWG
jgi:hypothetical protein